MHCDHRRVGFYVGGCVGRRTHGIEEIAGPGGVPCCCACCDEGVPCGLLNRDLVVDHLLVYLCFWGGCFVWVWVGVDGWRVVVVGDMHVC